MSKIALSVGTRAESVQVPVKYEIPKEVVTEAIVNAVAHRDRGHDSAVRRGGSARAGVRGRRRFSDRDRAGWRSGDQNPSAGRREIAATLGATRSIVRYRLDKLRAAGKIERVGPARAATGGCWANPLLSPTLYF